MHPQLCVVWVVWSVPAAPKGPNMFDGGAASKVQVNTQPYNNATDDGAEHSTEHCSAIPQAKYKPRNAIQPVRGRCNCLVRKDNLSTKQMHLLEQRKG